nr:PAS domain-containing protein [Desulfobacteraceae bacterium]
MLEFLKKDVLEENGRLRSRIEELEAAAAESRAHARRCDERTDAIAAPMFTVGKDLIIDFVNEAALQTMGYTRGEVVGKMTCADF